MFLLHLKLQQLRVLTLPADVYEVIFVGVIPSASNNSKVFEPAKGFLTVIYQLFALQQNLLHDIALNLIC